MAISDTVDFRKGQPKMCKYMIVTHIPRCAGSSFRKALYESCKKNDSYFYDKHIYISGITHAQICISDTPHLIEAIHHNTQLFFDHSYAQTFERLRGLHNDEVYKIILIRNPITRFVSHLNFFYKIDITTMTNSLVNETIDRFGPILQNITTRFLTNYSTDLSSEAQQIKMAKNELKLYNMIIRQEHPEDILAFNDTNPFEVGVCNENYINSTSVDYNLLNIDIKNKIYKYLKKDFKLLEKYYSI